MDSWSASFAFIDSVGGPEMMLVFVIVLILFGGKKLPEFARGLGKTVREFKKAAAGVEEEFKRALDEVDDQKAAVNKILAPPPPASLTAPDHTVPKEEFPSHASDDPHHYESEYSETEEPGHHITPEPPEPPVTPVTPPPAAAAESAPAAPLDSAVPPAPSSPGASPPPAPPPAPAPTPPVSTEHSVLPPKDPPKDVL